jgi:hypothetical protein
MNKPAGQAFLLPISWIFQSPKASNRDFMKTVVPCQAAILGGACSFYGHQIPDRSIELKI